MSFVALLEARTEQEIADREKDEHLYQTAEGEENVEATNNDEVEHSGALIEVIGTANVSSISTSFSISTSIIDLDRFRHCQ